MMLVPGDDNQLIVLLIRDWVKQTEIDISKATATDFATDTVLVTDAKILCTMSQLNDSDLSFSP